MPDVFCVLISLKKKITFDKRPGIIYIRPSLKVISYFFAVTYLFLFKKTCQFSKDSELSSWRLVMELTITQYKKNALFIMNFPFEIKHL